MVHKIVSQTYTYAYTYPIYQQNVHQSWWKLSDKGDYVDYVYVWDMSCKLLTVVFFCSCGVCDL